MDTVADLIRSLQQMPQDAKVWMMSDQEGNSTHWVEGVFAGKARKNLHGWSHVHSEDLEYYAGEELHDVAVIWPGYGEKFDE